jgi:anti-sigma factor RsiW
MTEADRLIAAALADSREPAPKRLRERLEREYLRRPRRSSAWLPAFAAGAVVAAVIAVFVAHSPAASPDLVAREAVGDHLRILVASHPLDVEASDMHQVKPWFAGRLEFVPPVSFLGDDDFPLRGGHLAVFLGHKAAAFVYGHRLHRISLFVYPDPDRAARAETTLAGFHVMTWQTGELGMALVSDLNWDDLRALESRLRRQ